MRISFSVLGKIGVFITLVVSLKAWLPIVCRPSLKLIAVILEQLLKAQSPILSTVLGIVSSLSIDELLFVKEALMSEIWYSTSLYLNFPPLKSNPDGAINWSTLVISTLLNTIYFISNTVNIYSAPSIEVQEEIKQEGRYKNKWNFIIAICLFIALNIALGSIPLIYNILQQEMLNLGTILF